eukprot:7563623-Prorocentrum_lima.AAC.1
MEFDFTWFDNSTMLIHEPLYVPVQQEARVSHSLGHHDQDPAPYNLPREIVVRIKDMAKEPKEQNPFPGLPFSVQGINAKIAKLEEARSHVVEAIRKMEEIEDDCYIPYCHDPDSDGSPRSPKWMSDSDYEGVVL